MDFYEESIQEKSSRQEGGKESIEEEVDPLEELEEADIPEFEEEVI